MKKNNHPILAQIFQGKSNKGDNMKKIGLFIFLAVFFLCANTGRAEDRVAVVKKGDTLSMIASKYFNLAFKDLSPQARNRVIFPGDVIRLNDLIGNEPAIMNKRAPEKKPPINSHLTKTVEYDEWGYRIVRSYGEAPFRRHPEPTAKAQLELDRVALEKELRPYCGSKKETAEKVKVILEMHKNVFLRGIENVPGASWQIVEDGIRSPFMLYADRNDPKGYLSLKKIVFYYGQKTQFAYIYPLTSEWELWYGTGCGNWFPVQVKVSDLDQPITFDVPKAPMFDDPDTQKRAIQIYEETVCANEIARYEFDAITGGTKTFSNAGTVDDFWWGFFSVRYIIGVDQYGNTHKIGPFIKWFVNEGDWTDPTGRFPNFEYNSKTYVFGAEYRLVTPEMMEYIISLGYAVREDKGASGDVWGTTDVFRKYTGGIFSLKVHDMSRIDENFWAEWSLEAGVTVEFSAEENVTWTSNSTGEKFQGNKSPDRFPGVHVHGNALLYQTDNRLLTVSVNGNWRLNNDEMSVNGTLLFGFFNNGIRIGPMIGATHNSEGSYEFYGIDWIVDGYRLYVHAFEEDPAGQVEFGKECAPKAPESKIQTASASNLKAKAPEGSVPKVAYPEVMPESNSTK